MTPWIDDLDLALRLADIADSFTMNGFTSPNSWWTKSDGSPVSAIDIAVEDAVRAEIARVRPGDMILGEEGRENDPFSDADHAADLRTWIIDPLDQTRHYLRGNPEFATLIALAVGGHTTVGVISAPALGHRWWATLGSGAWKDNRRLSVSGISRLKDAYVSLAGHREWHRYWEWERIGQLLDRCSYPFGSAGGFLQQMMVAEGIIDIFLEPWGEVWDHVGAALIVSEAGGKATTLSGTPPRGGSLIASNGHLHSEVLEYIIRQRS